MDVEVKLEDLEEGPLEVTASRKRLRKQAAEADLADSIEGEEEASEVEEAKEDVKPTPKSRAKKSGGGETPKKKRKLKEDGAAVPRADHLQKFHSLTPEAIEKMQTNLLAWYDEVRG